MSRIDPSDLVLYPIVVAFPVIFLFWYSMLHLAYSDENFAGKFHPGLPSNFNVHTLGSTQATSCFLLPYMVFLSSVLLL